MIALVLHLLPRGDTRLLIPGFAINVILLFSFGALGKPKKWSREEAVCLIISCYYALAPPDRQECFHWTCTFVLYAGLQASLRWKMENRRKSCSWRALFNNLLQLHLVRTHLCAPLCCWFRKVLQRAVYIIGTLPPTYCSSDGSFVHLQSERIQPLIYRIKHVTSQDWTCVYWRI